MRFGSGLCISSYIQILANLPQVALVVTLSILSSLPSLLPTLVKCSA